MNKWTLRARIVLDLVVVGLLVWVVHIQGRRVAELEAQNRTLYEMSNVMAGVLEKVLAVCMEDEAERR